MSNVSDLETRLQGELGATADEIRVSGDAWQQNQRRIAADAGHRRTRMLQLMSAAAVVALLAGAVALLPTRGPAERHPAQPPPNSKPTSSVVPPLGPGIVVDEKVIFKYRARASLMVSFQTVDDAGGSGPPSLCTGLYEDRLYGSNEPTSNSCGGYQENWSAPSVAFDYVDASTLGDLKGEFQVSLLSGAVDGRVSVVTANYPDGRTERLTLHKLAGDGYAKAHLEGYRVFGLIASGRSDPPPQRLVATAKDGSVLQAVDLTEDSDDWLPKHSACTDDPDGDPAIAIYPERNAQFDVGTSVAIGTTDAQIHVFAGGSNDSVTCVPKFMPGPIAFGQQISEGKTRPVRPRVVVIVGPEVSYVELQEDGQEVKRREPQAVDSTSWRIVVEDLGDIGDVVSEIVIVPYDGSGKELEGRATIPAA